MAIINDPLTQYKIDERGNYGNSQNQVLKKKEDRFAQFDEFRSINDEGQFAGEQADPLAEFRAGRSVSSAKPAQPKEVNSWADTFMGGMRSTENAMLADQLQAGIIDTEEFAQSVSENELLNRQKAQHPDKIKLIQDITDAEGFWETTGEVLKSPFTNPSGVARFTAEQVGNMLPSMGGAVTGAAAGSAVPVVGTGVGALIGMSLGTLAVETGHELLSSLHNDGVDLTDTEAVKTILTPEYLERSRKRGLIRGIAIAAFDLATIGASKWLMGAPARQLTNDLAKMGFDVSSKESIQRVLGSGNPAVIKAAEKYAKSKTLLGKAKTGAAPLALEVAGEPAGEAAAQVAVGDEIDGTEVALEALGGLGASIATAGTVGAYESGKSVDVPTGSEVTPSDPMDKPLSAVERQKAKRKQSEAVQTPAEQAEALSAVKHQKEVRPNNQDIETERLSAVERQKQKRKQNDGIDLKYTRAREEQAEDLIKGSNNDLEPRKIDEAAKEAAQSPENNFPEPTEAQKEAGNYKKGHVAIQGMDIAIENPKGSMRKGTDPQGNEWSNEIKSHYGYIKGTTGRDKDHVDVFIGDEAETTDQVYVVDQVDPKTGKFDEHKVMLGYADETAAKQAYLENYDANWKGLGAVSAMSMPDFKSWVANAEKTKKPLNPEVVLQLPSKVGLANADRETLIRASVAKLHGRAKELGIAPKEFADKGELITKILTMDNGGSRPLDDITHSEVFHVDGEKIEATAPISVFIELADARIDALENLKACFGRKTRSSCLKTVTDLFDEDIELFDQIRQEYIDAGKGNVDVRAAEDVINEAMQSRDSLTTKAQEQGGKIAPYVSKLVPETQQETIAQPEPVQEETIAENYNAATESVQSDNGSEYRATQTRSKPEAPARVNRERSSLLGRDVALGIADKIERAGSAVLVGRKIDSAKGLAELAQVYRNPKHETLRYFFTKDNKIVHSSGLTSRLADRAPLVPKGYENDIYGWIAQQMDNSGADGYWLLHNHPSGNPTPSKSDINVTTKMADAVPGFKGHVVINSNEFAFIDEAGQTYNEKVDFGEDRLLTPSIPSAHLNKQIDTPDALANVGKSLQKEGYVVVVGVSGTQGVRVITEVDAPVFSDIEKAKTLIKDIAGNTGSGSMFVYGAASDLANTKGIETLIEEGYAVDIVTDDGHSYLSSRSPNPSYTFGDKYTAGGDLVEQEKAAYKLRIDNNIDAVNRWLNGEPLSPSTGSRLGLADESRVERAQRLFQDGFNRVKKLQQVIEAKGGKVTDANNVYLAEERSSGITAARLDDLRDNAVKPLVKAMKAQSVTLKQLDSYLMAKHARERNAYIASINPDMPDGGSGLTNKEADKILADFAHEGMTNKLEGLSEMVYAINDNTLSNLVEAGLMTKDLARTMRQQYRHYVPLKGKAGVDYRAGRGSGFSVTGTGLKQALGRGDNNLAESPLAHTIAQAEEAIIRAEKNRVGQTLVRLMLDNPDPNFWTLTKRSYDRFIGLNGEEFEGFVSPPETLIDGVDYHRTMGITPAERKAAKAEGRKPKQQVVYKLDPSYKFRDDVFAVMIDGKLHQVTLKDKLLAEQLKKLNATQLNRVVQGMGAINRYLAMINTALNPEFVITNLERDLQTAGVNLAGEYSAKVAKQVMKDVPAAAKGIWLSVFGRESAKTNKWSRLYQELKHEGGTIGFFGLEDIDTKVRKLEKELTQDDSYLGNTRSAIKKVGEVVLDANQSVENAARLAAYKAGIDAGMSKQQAASLAKNLTVNFNRRGELAPALNAAYLFANASIQGSARIFTALKHPKVRKIVGGITVTSFALAAYNMAAGGDDDDDISHWEKISDYTKQTNLIIMYPDGSGRYFKLKLPYGYNVFWYAGIALHDLMRGENTTVMGTAGNLMTTIANAFNPIQGADLLDTITPTVLKPVEQDYRNINFMNTPIRPENPYDRYERPESDKAWYSTNEQLKAFAKFLNEASGGDDTHSGLIDISPETIKHYIGWLTGGAGMTVYRSIDTTTKLFTGEEINAKDVPFIRTLGGSHGLYYDTERFYDVVSDLEAVKAQLKLYQTNHDPRAGQYLRENRKKLALQKMIVRQKKLIKNLRLLRNKAAMAGKYDVVERYNQKIAKAMRGFTARYEAVN